MADAASGFNLIREPPLPSTLYRYGRLSPTGCFNLIREPPLPSTLKNYSFVILSGLFQSHPRTTASLNEQLHPRWNLTIVVSISSENHRFPQLPGRGHRSTMR